MNEALLSWQAQWMNDGAREGEGMDGGGARPICLAPAPFSSNLVAFLLRPSGMCMSKYSAQFSEGAGG